MAWTTRSATPFSPCACASSPVWREQLAAEIDELHKLIAYYQDLLAHREKILGVIKDELGQIVERFADKRRTSISSQEAQDLDVEDLIAEEDMVVTVTHSGYIKRLPVATYRSQRRGGKGVQGLSLKDNDFVEDLFVASTHDYVMFFTNFGRVYRLKVHELPIGSRQARGSAIVNVLSLAEGEHPAAVITCRDFPVDDYLMFATKNGMVKKTAMAEYDRTRRDGLIAINLKAGDELVNVRRVHPGDKVILVTTDGKAILFDESDVRAMGRDTSGVRGINLKGDASMLGMEISNGNGDLFVITENGYGKRTPVADYPEHKRGGQGVFTIAMTAKKGNLVACRVVGPQHELMIVSVDGVVIRVKTSDIPKLGRSTQGVKVMNLSESDHVSAVARMVAHKKKAPKHDANQGMLDLAAAGAKDADEEESVDIGGDEEGQSLCLIQEGPTAGKLAAGSFSCDSMRQRDCPFVSFLRCAVAAVGYVEVIRREALNKVVEVFHLLVMLLVLDGAKIWHGGHVENCLLGKERRPAAHS